MEISKKSPLKDYFGRYVGSLGFLSLLVMTSACETNFTSELEDIFALNENEGPGEIPNPDLGPQCFNHRFVQPEAVVTNKIDILFVTDTSGSLNNERQAVADGIDTFVAQLPAQVDYNVAVMLAHGHESSLYGKMYRSHHGEPHVLKSSEQSLEDIRSDLGRKLNNPTHHYAADGGEAGLYSLYGAFDAGRLADSKSKGFFRSDAALAVIFVADENDICYPGQVFDGDHLEDPAFDRYCDGVDSSSVLARIAAEKGDNPTLIAGVVYNGETAVPNVGEDELGLGYLDIIAQAGGISVDLGGGDIEGDLADIGTLAAVKLELLTEFTLANTEIDEDSIEVSVDGQPVAYVYDETLNKVTLTENAGGALSIVDINYCLEDANGGGDPDPGGCTNPNGCGGGIGV